MAASFSVRENTFGNGATHASASLTPADDSLWIIVATATNDDHSTAQSWQAPSGGSESYTEIVGIAQDDTSVTNFDWSQRVWTQAFTTSPSARTVTLDAFSGSQAADYGLTIIEVTGHDIASPVIQSASNNAVDGFGSEDLNVTTTFGSALSAGGLQLAISQAVIDANITWDAPPTNFTTDTSSTTSRVSAEINSSTTNTATGITHGTASGDTSHLGLVVVEIAEASAAASLAVRDSVPKRHLLTR